MCIAVFAAVGYSFFTDSSEYVRSSFYLILKVGKNQFCNAKRVVSETGETELVFH